MQTVYSLFVHPKGLERVFAGLQISSLKHVLLSRSNWIALVASGLHWSSLMLVSSLMSRASKTFSIADIAFTLPWSLITKIMMHSTCQGIEGTATDLRAGAWGQGPGTLRSLSFGAFPYGPQLLAPGPAVNEAEAPSRTRPEITGTRAQARGRRRWGTHCHHGRAHLEPCHM